MDGEALSWSCTFCMGLSQIQSSSLVLWQLIWCLFLPLITAIHHTLCQFILSDILGWWMSFVQVGQGEAGKCFQLSGVFGLFYLLSASFSPVFAWPLHRFNSWLAKLHQLWGCLGKFKIFYIQPYQKKVVCCSCGAAESTALMQLHQRDISNGYFSFGTAWPP